MHKEMHKKYMNTFERQTSCSRKNKAVNPIWVSSLGKGASSVLWLMALPPGRYVVSEGHWPEVEWVGV